jgi:hypothetical protein
MSKHSNQEVATSVPTLTITEDQLNELIATRVAEAMKAKKATKKGWEPTYGRTECPTRDEALAHYGDTSKAIRGLAASGYTKGAIAKHLDIRYQHVNNVLNTPLKK